MNNKPIMPEMHEPIDYALVGSLLTVPAMLGFNKKIKKLYAAEVLLLLAYVAMTDQPAAVKPLIPFPVHGKIDPFNVGQFALQTFFNPFRKDKNASVFNIVFTLPAGRKRCVSGQLQGQKCICERQPLATCAGTMPSLPYRCGYVPECKRCRSRFLLRIRPLNKPMDIN